MNTLTCPRPLLVVARVLRELAANDQRMRSECRFRGSHLNSTVVRNNTESLKSIVAEIGGWPTKQLVGAEASQAAWLIAYHSDDLAQQEEWLRLMKACSAVEVSRACAAHLEDRVLRKQGKPQIYGTEFTVSKEGKFESCPISDPANVDRRRMEAGLDTLHQNLLRLHSEYPEIGI